MKVDIRNTNKTCVSNILDFALLPDFWANFGPKMAVFAIPGIFWTKIPQNLGKMAKSQKFKTEVLFVFLMSTFMEKK